MFWPSFRTVVSRCCACLLLVLPLACRTGAGSSAGVPATPGTVAPGTLGATANLPVHDPHSHAQPDRVRVRHVSLAMDLDFGARAVRATARLRFDRPDPAAPLVLDTNGLAIAAVTGLDGKPRPYQLGAEDKVRGTPLTITLSPGDTEVKIAYRTTEKSEALQWLAPEQTRDRKQPFLFTQGQSIYTRSWIPAAGLARDSHHLRRHRARPGRVDPGDERRAAGPRRRRRLALPHDRADPALPHRPGLRRHRLRAHLRSRRRVGGTVAAQPPATSSPTPNP